MISKIQKQLAENSVDREKTSLREPFDAERAPAFTSNLEVRR
jgi:hypothetical protein